MAVGGIDAPDRVLIKKEKRTNERMKESKY